MDSIKPRSRKDRTINFNQNEATKLRVLLSDYPIILSKQTDHGSNQQKDAAWLALAGMFNSDAVIYRSVKQLQQKFNNMKKTARMEMSAEKSGRRQTGGGPPPPKPSENTEWLNTIMGESISGLPAEFDSDYMDTIVDDDERTVNNTAASSVILDFVEDEKIQESEKSNALRPLPDEISKMQNIDVSNNIETEADTKGSVVVFDSSTPKALLRKPISKQLTNGYNKRKGAFTPVETRKRIISHFDGKIDFLSKKKAREEEIQKYAQEEHMQNMKQKQELHQKELTQTEDKHSLYTQQQKEMHTLDMQFKREMHELLLEKIKLEIQLIKK